MSDDRPPLQQMILEVLAARHRLGEPFWPFVVVADWIPAQPRPVDIDLYGAQAVHGAATTRDLPVIVFDPAERTRWRERALEAQERHREVMRRQLAHHEGVVAELRAHLAAEADASGGAR